MGFVLGIVLGVASGIGLIMAMVYYENIRAKRRTDLAATVAAFSRMTVEDARKIFTPEQYPPWVIFPQMEKLKWLNTQLEKLWPYINQAASELIRSTMEPILEQYRPVILASLTFKKLTLGTVAPQFTGICILDSEPGEIVMEIEMQWDGNPNIVLDVKTHVGIALPIQIKNIGFTGLFRIIFKPLLNEFPCFGAVSYSLREKKDLDFKLKVIGGDMSMVPGLSDSIDEMIRDAIEDSITWPVRKIIPIIPGDYSDLELKPHGILEVKLVQAKELSNKDLIGKSDPFASLFIRPLRNRTKKSKTISNQLNPIWNESFDFVVEDPATQHLTVRVYDDEGLQPPQLIGCAQIPINVLEPGKVKIEWLNLVKDLKVQRDRKNRGQVHLELLYCPFGTENQILNPFSSIVPLTDVERVLKDTTEDDASDIERKTSEKKHEVILRGVLSVTVVSAENLPVMDLTGKSDPYVTVSLKKAGTKMKTRVLNETLNPVWNQTFDFVVEDALHELLIFEVYDHDTIGKNYMGRCIMTLTRVLLEGDLYDIFDLDGTTSGRLALHLKWTPQPIMRDV
ncbi:synaptotagmin-5-like isoform X1 [Chenopodium quinoa]|uniref:synaptotagmin-5-like isoform X1 n=2 Tax=Chenopodium quinoa TaxID=63459 RepID=UPI000B79423A|nr:synaptotagmin-5-like isoform X1 [Chenopodium quinoa]